MEEANAAEIAKTVGAGAVEEIRHFIHIDDLRAYLTIANLARVATSVIAILIFWIVYRLIRHAIKKGTEKRFEPGTVKVLTKAVSYIFYVLIVMYVLGLFGIKLTAIWGAAGIAGVAIGFAAQTTVSNLISGIFIVTEKTMKIGDFIEVGGVSGTVDKVGLLSIKLRTLDNQLIRIPSSTIINTQFINYASFDLRRFCFPLQVGYEDNLEKALELLMTIPEKCPSVIKDDPDHLPAAVYTGLGDTGIEVSLNVWFKREDLAKVKNEVFIAYMNLCQENPEITCAYKRIDVSVLNESQAKA